MSNGGDAADVAWCNADTNLAGYRQINVRPLICRQTVGTLA